MGVVGIDVFTLCPTENENDTWIITMHYDRKDYGREIVLSTPTEINKDHLEILKIALKDSSVFNLNDKYFWAGIPRSLTWLFIEVGFENGNVLTLHPCILFCSYDPLPITNCSEGVELRRLTEEDAGTVVRNWKYAKEFTTEYIQKIIRELPSGGVFYKGELVSYILNSAYGVAAFLHTDDKHRRKGYAKLAMLFLLNEMKASGLIPVSTVEAQNEGSIKLHYQCEMEMVDNLDYLLH